MMDVLVPSAKMILLGKMNNRREILDCGHNSKSHRVAPHLIASSCRRSPDAGVASVVQSVTRSNSVLP